jgi:hypothetical protein
MLLAEKWPKDIILFSNSVLKQELLYKPALHPVTRIFKMLQSGSYTKKNPGTFCFN